MDILDGVDLFGFSEAPFLPPQERSRPGSYPEPAPKELVTREEPGCLGVSLTREHYERYLRVRRATFHEREKENSVGIVDEEERWDRRKVVDTVRTTRPRLDEPPPPPLYTTERICMPRTYTELEVAELAGLSKATIAAWRKGGRIPPEYVVPDTRPIAYLANKIDRWIEEQTPEAVEDVAIPEGAGPDETESPDRDTFVHGFWSGHGEHAADVLSMPADMREKVLAIVTDALDYGYGNFS